MCGTRNEPHGIDCCSNVTFVRRSEPSPPSFSREFILPFLPVSARSTFGVSSRRTVQWSGIAHAATFVTFAAGSTVFWGCWYDLLLHVSPGAGPSYLGMAIVAVEGLASGYQSPSPACCRKRRLCACQAMILRKSWNLPGMAWVLGRDGR